MPNSHHSKAYHPQAQGLMERFNRTLKSSLKCHENPSEWYDQLSCVLLALCSGLKEDHVLDSPNSIVFGEYIRLPGDFFANTIEECQEPEQAFTLDLARYASALFHELPRHENHKSYLEMALFASETSHV